MDNSHMKVSIVHHTSKQTHAPWSYVKQKFEKRAFKQQITCNTWCLFFLSWQTGIKTMYKYVCLTTTHNNNRKKAVRASECHDFVFCKSL